MGNAERSVLATVCRTFVVMLTAAFLAACIEDGNEVTASAASTAMNASADGAVASNAAPAIVGAPQSWAQAGQAYKFQPTSTDADGDSLSFSVSNKPAWTSFSTVSGQLSGTPAEADVGVYSNIVITVSDGKVSRALPGFTIAVNQISTGTATLSWLPPTENIDGTPLVGLAGYIIYYSNDPSSLGGQTVKLSNSGLTRYVVENLGAARWYFSVKTYTASGQQSDFSAIATKTIT